MSHFLQTVEFTASKSPICVCSMILKERREGIYRKHFFFQFLMLIKAFQTHLYLTFYYCVFLLNVDDD